MRSQFFKKKNIKRLSGFFLKKCLVSASQQWGDLYWTLAGNPLKWTKILQHQWEKAERRMNKYICNKYIWQGCHPTRILSPFSCHAASLMVIISVPAFPQSHCSQIGFDKALILHKLALFDIWCGPFSWRTGRISISIGGCIFGEIGKSFVLCKAGKVVHCLRW